MLLGGETERLDHLVVTGMTEGKRIRGKTVRRNFEWTNKVAKCRTSDRCTIQATSDHDALKVKIGYTTEQPGHLIYTYLHLLLKFVSQ